MKPPTPSTTPRERGGSRRKTIVSPRSRSTSGRRPSSTRPVFTVDSSRILFAAARGRPGATTATTPRASTVEGAVAHRYRIEVSSDGKTFTTLLDKTQNTVTKYVEFDELPPTTCRFVRLTLTDWPHSAAAPLGIVEFTVFGKGVSPSKLPGGSGGD